MDESYLSWLRLIPGVTPDLAKRIAERYPDPELLRGAGPEDLARVPGVTVELAARVLELIRTAANSDAAWYKDEPSLYLCPECGSFVGKGSSACPFCGVVFDEEETPSEAPEVEDLLQARNGEAKICTRCGAFLGPGEARCAMCGAEYPAEKRAELPAVDVTPVPETDLYLCPHCGAFLGEGAESCMICGKPVGREEKILGLARAPKGVSKDFLTRWQKAAVEERPAPPEPPRARTLEDELLEYDRLLEADPSRGRAWVRKGRILIELGRAAEAVDCFDHAARLDPAKEEEYKLEVLSALEPADWSVLPPRWAGEVEATRPAPEPQAPEAEEAPAPPEVVEAAPEEAPLPAMDAAAARRALAVYDRLLDMDAGLRVAWQTKGELLARLGRTADAEACFRRAADLEIAERELGRAALTGLQTRGPSRPRAAAGRGAAQGRTNGRVNGLTNGLRGRTNGLTNGRGRTNGRVNGITNGAGSTNGLTNGLGRVNGLMSGLARGEGRTNGLVNGNGFTNGRRGGRARPLPRRGREWARSTVGIAAVVLLMVLAPILASLFTTTPAPTGLVIDGRFADWAGIGPRYADPAGDQPDADVDLVAYKVFAEDATLSVYTQVRAVAFNGAGNTADILVALIDADGRRDTGYDAGALGADYMAELVGWDNGVRDAPLFQFDPAANRTDWFGFARIGGVSAASAGSETEFSLDLDRPETARVLLVAVDGEGRTDAADAVVVASRPALSVREWTIAPDVIASTAGVAILRLDLSPAGPPVSVTAVNVTRRGSLPDAGASLTLYEDVDRDGVLTSADAVRGTAGLSQGRASFPLTLTVASNVTLLVAADFAAPLPENGTFGLALEGLASTGVASVASEDATLSYLARAPEPTVDGAFADWNAVPRSPDPIGDVMNRSGVPPLVNANVDLTEVASHVAANASFLLRVDGTMLGGVDVPNLRARTSAVTSVDSDRDTVPDDVEFALPNPDLRFDFNNDGLADVATGNDVDNDTVLDYPSGSDYWLNTTIPAWYPAPYAGRFVSVYIGPVIPQTLEGVDSAIAYVDADNSSATGLVVTVGPATYGFDWALAVVGRHGAVASSGLYRYQAGPAVPWTFVAALPAAVGGGRLEVSVPAALLNLSADYRTVYYASDWRLSSDLALPVPPGRSPAPGPGTRSPAGDNVVINEVSPLPNPEWVELANPTSGSISLAGWTLQRQKGFKWETFYTFVGGTIGAWGSGTEYFVANLPTNSLPNGQATIRLVDAAGRVVDITTYQPTGSGKTWSRFKDPTTGKPRDTDNDANDFYVSLYPSKGGPNDRHRPTIAVAKTGNRATAAPGDLITYTVYYNNTDTGRANHVWVNDTLPSQVTFVSSSATPAGNSGQAYYWHFTNVGPTTNNQFTVTVRVNDNVPNGASLVNRAVLEYTDQLNRKMTGSTAWWNVTCSRPVITVAKIGDKNTALPGDTIVYTIFYNNTGSANAAHVWINDTLPMDVTFLSSSVPWTSRSGQTYRWHLTNVAPGAHSFTISARVNLNATSSTLVNWVFLNYTTQNGYPLQSSSASWTVSIPEFSDLAIVAIVPLVVLGVRRLRRRNAGKKGTVADSVPGIGGR